MGKRVARSSGLNAGLYDSLKWIAQIVLPGLGTLYFGLSSIWHLPYATEVVGTIAAVGTFLGIVLGISSAQYNNSDARFDGEAKIDDEGRMYLTGDLTLEQLVGKKQITFKGPDIPSGN